MKNKEVLNIIAAVILSKNLYTNTRGIRQCSSNLTENGCPEYYGNQYSKTSGYYKLTEWKEYLKHKDGNNTTHGYTGIIYQDSNYKDVIFTVAGEINNNHFVKEDFIVLEEFTIMDKQGQFCIFKAKYSHTPDSEVSNIATNVDKDTSLSWYKTTASPAFNNITRLRVEFNNEHPDLLRKITLC
ncbi:hypothetical protein CPAV1605_130 [seawater metagenome]|uniref:Uncharacterized protein n=1 Tax=seawater metagenome TaxID=1561972 RepID=A0A5E8CG64_9ZZZZ